MQKENASIKIIKKQSSSNKTQGFGDKVQCHYYIPQ